MGALSGKPRVAPVPKQPAEKNSLSTTSRRSSQVRRSILNIIQRKSRETAYSEEMDENDDGDGWFPVSRMFPDDPEFRLEALKILRAWHADSAVENHLPPLKDLQLLLFVHSCLKDIEEAKLAMKKFYSSMVDLPFLFSDWDVDVEAMKQCFDALLFAVMPVENVQGHKIMIMRFRNTDPEVYHFKDAAKAVLMSIEALELLEGPPKGLSVVLDVSGMKMGHFTRFHMSEVKQFLGLTQSDSCAQDVLPVIMQDVDVIHCNYLVPLIMTTVRPFLSSKIVDMVKVHTSHDRPSFISKYTKSCLPNNYDGDLASLEFYHNENLDRIRRIIPYWQERQKWIDERRSHRKSSHRSHGVAHATTSSGATTNRPSRAATPS